MRKAAGQNHKNRVLILLVVQEETIVFLFVNVVLIFMYA